VTALTKAYRLYTLRFFVTEQNGTAFRQLFWRWRIRWVL